MLFLCYTETPLACHVNSFGEYRLDLNRQPSPIDINCRSSDFESARTGADWDQQRLENWRIRTRIVAIPDDGRDHQIHCLASQVKPVPTATAMPASTMAIKPLIMATGSHVIVI
jgi:hypothetical protein